MTSSMPLTDELEARVDLLLSVVGDLEEYLEKWDGPISLPRGMDVRAHLKLIAGNGGALSAILQHVETIIGESLTGFKTVVPGHGEVRRHKRKRETDWQSDDLLRVVMDSRIVDKDTGEIESDVAKIRRVWNLAGYSARRGALKKLGIDPSEFCHVEELPGWSLETR